MENRHIEEGTLLRRSTPSSENPRRTTNSIVFGSILLIGLSAAGPAADAAILNVSRQPPCSDASGAPYCTISAAVAKAVAGDTVLVGAGTYAERITVSRSGAVGAPISIVSNGGAVVTQKTYGFDLSGVQWIVVKGFTISNTSSHAIRCILCSNVLIEDNQVRSAGGSGIYVVSASDIALSRNSVEDCVQHGVDVNDATRVLINGGFVTRSGARISGKSRKGIKFTGASDSTIEGTAVFDNSDIGVYLVDGTTGVRVRGVVAHHNARGFERAASGIESRSDGNIIESNITYENEDSGINLRWGGSNGLIINNVADRNGDHGIDVLDSPYARVINNTVYKNITAGINVEGSSANAVIANNISVGNAVDSPRTEGDIRVTSASMPAQADYNIVYSSGSEKIYQWGTHYYRTLRYLQNEFPGVEVNGLQADPKWVEPSLNDFHLKSGSAAIDSAKSSAIQTAEIDKDAEGNSRCDDPNTPNTGSGPRTFDDRGALEYIDMSYCPIASASE